ncbi:MAG TPA: hypothetical protein VGF95_12240 [Solirubrobacteraceae bacterium]
MPMTMLQARGHEIVWYGSSNDALPIERLRNCDLIHVYRASHPRLVKALAALRSNGVAISWDNDDDVTAISEHSPSYGRLGGVRGQQEFRQQIRAIKIADLVTTTNATLAQLFMQAGAHHVIPIENYLPPEFARSAPESQSGIVVGWAALREHEADLTLLSLGPVLLSVLEANPRVRLTTVGIRIGITHTRYEHRPLVPFHRLAAVLGGFDIGLAPLADISFNRARSNIKLKEYAIMGVPWLASPVGEYRKLGHKQGGRTVADDEWETALIQMIRSRRDRIVLATRGRLWGRRQTIELNVDAWERAFADCVARVQANR